MPCWIIVRLKDRAAPDHPNYNKMFQKGDVVEVLPEGWDHGSLDLCSDAYIHILLKDKTVREATLQYCAPEPGDPLKNPNLRRRAVKFDLSLLPPDVQAVIAKRTQIDPKINGRDKTYQEIKDEYLLKTGYADCFASGLDLAAVVKPVIPNPFNVGKDPFVVG